MNIQAEKIELIKQITEINSEALLKKIKNLITTSRKLDETERIESNPVMVKRLKESKQQIKESKGIKVSLDDIWK